MTRAHAALDEARSRFYSALRLYVATGSPEARAASTSAHNLVQAAFSRLLDERRAGR